MVELIRVENLFTSHIKFISNFTIKFHTQYMFGSRGIQQLVNQNKKQKQHTFLNNQIDQLSFLRQNAEKMQTQLKSLIKQQVVLSQNPENTQARRTIICNFLKNWSLETELILQKCLKDSKKIEQAITNYDNQANQEVYFSKKQQELYVIFLNAMRFQLRKHEKTLYQRQNFTTHNKYITSRICLTERIETVIQQPQLSQVILQGTTKAFSRIQYQWKILKNISENFNKRILLEKQLTSNIFKCEEKIKMDLETVISKVLYKEKCKNLQFKKMLTIIKRRSEWMKKRQETLGCAINNLTEGIQCIGTEKAIQNMIKNNNELSPFHDIPRYFKYAKNQINLKYSKGVNFLKGSSKTKSCPKNFKPKSMKKSIKNIIATFDGCKSITMSFMGHLGQVGVLQQ